MKKAFTMIELIFVIVIIGILAAVAIPKLSATRDDAKISSIIANAKVALNDFQNLYTSRGNTEWNNAKVFNSTSALLFTACDTKVNDTTLVSPNTFVLCNDNVICLSFQTIEEGNLTISNGVDTSDPICEVVKSDPAIIGLSNKTYKLGGETIVR